MRLVCLQTRDTAIGTHPDVAVQVFHHGTHMYIAHALLLVVDGDAAHLLAVKAHGTLVGGSPYPILGITYQMIHGVGRDIFPILLGNTE